MKRPIPLACRVVALLLASSACGPSPGEVEGGCEGWRPGAAIFTELLPDPEGTDTGQEWLELHNPGPSAVDLRGLLLYAARPDGSQEKTYLFEESVPVEVGHHVVLGDVRSGAPPPFVHHSYGDALGALGNTGGLIGLRCGDVLVDEVRYSGPSRSGVARIYDGRLVPDASDNDEPGRWCDAPPSTPDGGVRSSPGAANPACATPLGGVDGGVPGGTCLSPGTETPRSVARPSPGDLVITEVLADPKAVSDAQGEWVEVYAVRDVDLNGILLANEGSGRALFNGPRCLELKGGTHAVLARGTDSTANGGLSPVLGSFSFGLGNSAGAHALRLSLEGVLLDEVRWTSAAVPGVSWQLDPSRKDPSRNDEEGSFCLTPEGIRYNAVDRGTPGAENRPCAP